VEALRTLDRRYAQGGLAAADFAERRAFVLALLDGVSQVELSDGILDRAESAFPTPLRTLDALHLATAWVYARDREESLTFATHDAELAIGARALGFDVIGV
jgi:predicted nucleic acid-binding protein